MRGWASCYRLRLGLDEGGCEGIKSASWLL